MRDEQIEEVLESKADVKVIAKPAEVPVTD